MKKRNVIFATIAFAVMSIFVGCGTSADKTAAAEKEVAEAKENLADAKRDAILDRKVEAKEWQDFQDESSDKITSNNIKIAELKRRMLQSGQLENAVLRERIINLEMKNTELRKRMETYDASQNDWASFKREFSNDMDELGESLEDLTVDSKK